jgi:hypothetical protein
MKKHEKKLLKLASKAQDCTSRKQAVKILKKMTKISEVLYRYSKDAETPIGVNDIIV